MLMDGSFGADDSWDDFEGGDGELGSSYRVVVLRDTNLDRVIECFVDRELEVDGKKYATLLPVDTPVILAGYTEVNGTSQLVPVLEDASIDKLFPTASAVLAEMDLTLSRSAVVLTVEGRDDSIDDEEDEDDEDFDGPSIVFLGGGDEDDEEPEERPGDIEDVVSSLVREKSTKDTKRTMPVGLKTEELVDRSKQSGDGGDKQSGDGGDGSAGLEGEEDEEDEEGNEKVQVLATFFSDGTKYVVAAPLEPVLIIGAPASKPADVIVDVGRLNELNSMLGTSLEMPEPLGDVEYLLPDREELERVTPRIEAKLETLWDEEEKERKGLMRFRQHLIAQWGDKKPDDDEA